MSNFQKRIQTSINEPSSSAPTTDSCHRGGPPRSMETGVLFHPVRSSKAVRGVESHSGLKKSQLIHSVSQIQNVFTNLYSSRDSSQRFSSFHRPHGGLSSHSHPVKASTVSPIQLCRKAFSIPGSSLRTGICTKGLHKGPGGRGGSPETTTGLTVLKHVLTPRVKATHVAVDSMKSYLDAVYDITIAYEGTTDHKGQRKSAPTMTEFLCKECPRIHIHIERIELKDIPGEQMFMRRWLHDRFEVKDKLLIEFYDAKDSKRRNRFPGKSVHAKLSLQKTLPSVLFLSGLTASMLLTESGRKLYIKTWIYGSLLGCLWVSIKA
ncbi:1-acyl-sn-glycerol-3-phosphate acyltransferase epsilon-like isoform X3 [Pantherophis guttatus]|nr:1-acyl-sn-glycerol-3-phosphate acyltransferase epsilon-like isoform X3 [Pantherophis guttatus]